MKIAIRRGHNDKAIGAHGILKEEQEALLVKNEVIKYLRGAGHEVIDVSPSSMGVNEDLRWGVDLANKNNVDLFVSIHFNKAYDSYDGAIGSECWTIGAGEATNIAKRIVDNFTELGFKNRGVKHRGLYELKYTKMKAIIVEVCFVEATKDVELYKSLGVSKIGKCIAEGITGQRIASESSEDIIYRVKVDGTQVGAYREPTNVINQVKNQWGAVDKIEIERR